MSLDPYAMLRFLDEAGLNPYQHRLMTHYWRRGECWESLRTTAEICNISLGKTSETRQWLLDNGYIELVAGKNGRMCIVVSVRVANEVNNTQEGAVIVHYANDYNNERSQDERDVHDTNTAVHDVNAILNNKVNNKVNTYDPPLIGGFSVDTDLYEPFDPVAYEQQAALEEMVSALSKEARETLTAGRNEEKFKNAALGLMALGYGPADVKGFRDWWQENGWYTNNGRPSLAHLVDHFKDFKDNICLKPGKSPTTNGHAPNPAEAAWTTVLGQLRSGRWTLPRDGPETQALNRAGGWSALRNTQERELDFFKRRFLDAYQAAH